MKSFVIYKSINLGKLLVTMGARVAQVPAVPLLVSPQGMRGGVVLRAILTLVHPG